VEGAFYVQELASYWLAIRSRLVGVSIKGVAECGDSMTESCRFWL